MVKSEVGVIGLGVMGKSLSLNMAEKGFKVSVYNRTDGSEEHVVSNFIKENNSFKNILGFTHLEAFVSSIERPRKLLIMIKAGSAVDAVIDQLIPILNESDVIIDGGNSHYLDTLKRSHYLAQHAIYFVGCGISGGEEGARTGPCLMPGGAYKGYQIIAPLLEKISAKDSQQKPCCAYIGKEGAGHFIKMVHNGIEYAEMQLLAEVYAVLKTSMNQEEIAKVLSAWLATDLSSYLLEITIKILKRHDGKYYVLDTILDKAGNKGTGSWSSKTALDLGAVTTMMSSAVFARYVSSFKAERAKFSKDVVKEEQKEILNIKDLEKAYRFARIINHHQGFELMRMASLEYDWHLNLSEIARIWTQGCIIRSHFMETSANILKDHASFLESPSVFKKLLHLEHPIKDTLSYALNHRIGFDAFWSAYHYWISMTTETLPANLIQAQRDFFGAHTYQLKGDSSSEYYHTNWNEA
ncbi:NADP-dependent phosphogluconate dehydrogenase [Yeosuana sp. AK3]